MRYLLKIIGLLTVFSLGCSGADTALTPTVLKEGSSNKKTAIVIPVRDEIGDPVLYVIRRGLKEAIEQKADVVILDMNTPGGSIATTFEILEALEKFPGQTITFVNKDAISAGALISAGTGEIYFAPKSRIGAAAPVNGDGKDIDKTMKEKVVSYLKARVRAETAGKGYRGQVISAMIDEDMELKIGDKVLKEKGKLLALTADEAATTYGEPGQPLLAAGIVKDVDALLTAKYGAGNYEIRKFEVTWSEELASYLNQQAVKSLLLGLGILAIFIEMKTPGFGFFGITGGVLLGIVFLSSYVAGLSGHEPMAVFALGVALMALEIFFFPGVVVVALIGLVMVFGSLVWAMADVWPNQPVTISGDMFVGPMINLLVGVAVAVALALALAKFIPSGWFFQKMGLVGAAGGPAQIAGMPPEVGARAASLLGATGVAATALFPSGQVTIAGRRYEARVEVGSVQEGAAVRVTRVSDFGLVVEEVV